MKKLFSYLKNSPVLGFPAFLLFLAGLLIGGVLMWSFGGDMFDSWTEKARGYEIRGGGYRFINPLLECEVHGEESMGKELKPFKHKIEELVDEKISGRKATHISVYFRDLNNGPWFGIKEKEEFSPASLLKVPIMMAYLKIAETDQGLLSKKIKNEQGADANLIENIRASKEVERGKSYTVDELLYRMIVYSDNGAKDLLLVNVDASLFNKPFLDLGIEIPGVRKAEDFMSVKTYASFFRVLYNASYLNKEMSEKALAVLSEVEFDKGLVGGVPRNIAVAHKFGERRLLGEDSDVKQLHDCGIIYYPGRPYLLCVMTRGRDFDALIDNVKDISFVVFEEIEAQSRNNNK